MFRSHSKQNCSKAYFNRKKRQYRKKKLDKYNQIGLYTTQPVGTVKGFGGEGGERLLGDCPNGLHASGRCIVVFAAKVSALNPLSGARSTSAGARR
jgi:hypothetical protein